MILSPKRYAKVMGVERSYNHQESTRFVFLRIKSMGFYSITNQRFAWSKKVGYFLSCTVLRKDSTRK